MFIRPNNQGQVRRILPIRQVKTVLHIVLYILNDLLRKPAPEQSICFLQPRPAYTRRLYRAFFISIQLTLSEAYRQQLICQIVTVRPERAYRIPYLALVKEVPYGGQAYLIPEKGQRRRSKQAYNSPSLSIQQQLEFVYSVSLASLPDF